MARATRLLSTHFGRDNTLKNMRYVGIAAVPVVVIVVTLVTLFALGVLSPKSNSHEHGLCWPRSCILICKEVRK